LRIGVSSASLYPQLPTEKAIVNIAAMGCKTVEVFLQTRREYHPAYIQKLSRLCRLLQLDVHSLHAASSQYEPMLFYSYRRQNLDGQDILKRVLEAGAILGAQYLVFHGALRVENQDPSRILAGLRQVAATAAKWGLKLALENVSWCIGWSPEVFKWLESEAIPNLYYTFDTKQAVRSGFSPQEFLKVMGNRLGNVHISDGYGGVPDAKADFSELVKTLNDVGYAGPVILEVYGGKVQTLAQLFQGWKVLNSQVKD